MRSEEEVREMLRSERDALKDPGYAEEEQSIAERIFVLCWVLEEPASLTDDREAGDQEDVLDVKPAPGSKGNRNLMQLHGDLIGSEIWLLVIIGVAIFLWLFIVWWFL